MIEFIHSALGIVGIMYKYLVIGIVVIAVSSDLFGEWMSQGSGLTGTLYDVYFADTLHGWIAGGGNSIGGRVLITNDGGKIWGVVYPAINSYIELEGGDTVRTSVSIYTIEFLNSLEGWAGGGDSHPDYHGRQQNAVMFHSTRGGKTWNDKGHGDGYSIHGNKIDERISSVNEICIGDSTYGFYMVNRHHLTSGDFNDWLNIYSLDKLHQWTSSNYSYGVAICCIASSHVWVLIHKYLNGIKTEVFWINTEIESLTSICEMPTSFSTGDMDFADTLQGWIVRDGGIIYHTVDGGKAWVEQVSGVTNGLYTVDFLDSLNGWAGGENGTIIRTRDGGDNWIIEETPVSSRINSICFVDTTHGWVVGDSGVILCYGGSGIWEKDFTIIQNVDFNVFPNLFAMSIIIKYQLPVESKVLLRIYNAVGRVVKTLVNRGEVAGNYSVSFDAKGLSAGIYFAKFVAGDYKKTEKLILMR